MSNKVTIELEIEDAQELASTLNTKVRQIDWTLVNKPPKRQSEAVELDLRAKTLQLIATSIENALNKRALEEAAK